MLRIAGRSRARIVLVGQDSLFKRLSSDDGGNVLIKRGGDRQQQFRFADPMMQPYVVIRGIQTKMIDESAKTTLFKREQSDLFA
jgi:hypothetical protein